MAEQQDDKKSKSAQVLDLKLNGLYINPNNLSGVPQGAMLQADNVVLNRDNILESRRGQKVYGNALTNAPKKLFNFRDGLIAHSDSTMSYDSDGAGTWVDYTGTFNDPATGYSMRAVEANKNFYFSTSAGIKKLDSITGTIVDTGAPAALGGTGSTTGTSGFFLTGTNVAYQIVWGYTDSNDNLILGAPSQSIVVANTAINITGTTTSGSTSVTSLSSTTGLATGMLVSGAGITAGTTIISIDTGASSMELSTNAATNSSLLPLSCGFNTNTSLTFVIPQGITTDWFYQIYRSQMSASITTSPGVEFAQVLESNPTSDQISAMSVTVTDITPEDLKGTLLYTNPSQGGAAAAQYQPPLAKDMCFYQNYTFYANTISKNNMFLTLTGAGNGVALSYVTITGNTSDTSTTVSALSTTANLRVGMRVVGTGIPTNTTIVSIDGTAHTMVISNSATADGTTVSFECQDRLTVSGINYWAGSSSSANQFLVSGNSDPAIAIRETSYNLINTVNTYASSAIYGFYQSGFTDLPGKMLFQERGIGGSAFYVTSTNGTSFNPNLENTGTNNASKNDANQNYLYYSAYSQPEAVPLMNFFPVGSADYPIRRIIALRQCIMILKDDGIYRLFNIAPPFSVVLSDTTTKISAPDSAVNFNNQVYFMSLQGVVSLSDAGTPDIISLPIEVELKTISSAAYPNFATATFGVSYESDRTYLLGTVTNPSDTYATQMFAYNYVTKAWTRWPLKRTCGIVKVSDDKLYMGEPVSKAIYQERKDYSASDYADEEYAVTITSYSNYNVNMSSTSNVIVGMTLGQSSRTAVITSINSSTQVTVDSLYGWVNGAATIYTPILNQVQWVQFDGGNAGMTKSFRECTFFFRNAAFKTMTVGFSTNFATSPEYITIFPVSQGGWGNFPWGSQPWGGQLGGFQAIRTYVLQDQRFGNWLQVQLSCQQAFTSFSLEGISIPFAAISERLR